MNAMNLKSFLVLGLFSLFTFTSCLREESDTVDQNKIFTEYELFYNANEDKTYARATFKFSNVFGTKLELADPSEVSFNGDVLTFNPVLAYYEREYAGLLSNGTFQWVDTEGVIYVNSINFKTIAYPEGITSIDRSTSFDLIWQGAPLEEKENVSIWINGENELDGQFFFTNDLGAQNIILDKDKLENVGAGEGIIYMDWRYLPGLTESTEAGGVITGRYRPENLILIFE